jgi:hypothetical protein
MISQLFAHAYACPFARLLTSRRETQIGTHGCCASKAERIVDGAREDQAAFFQGNNFRAARFSFVARGSFSAARYINGDRGYEGTDLARQARYPV